MSQAHTWTDEQWQAITARGASLLVSAAAGSGKTAVLVERVIQRLIDSDDPVEVDRLLVVTFTEAAAGEMRKRMGEALQEALARDPGNVRLHRQLALLNRASISTLHAFCLSVIRENFHRLGIDPNFGVLGEHEAHLLQPEVLDKLFEAGYAGELGNAFFLLVDGYGGDSDLRQHLLRLFEYSRSLPWPDTWLDQAADRFMIEPESSLEALPWMDSIRRAIRSGLERAQGTLEMALNQAEAPEGPAIYRDTLIQDLAWVHHGLALAGQAPWDDLRDTLSAPQFGRLPQARRGSCDELLKERAKTLRDQAKGEIQSLGSKFLTRSAAECLDDLRSLAPLARALVGLVRRFGEAYAVAKASRALADFGDLEQLCLTLLLAPEATPGNLVPSEVVRELRRRYAEVLVDEYQDINGVQDAILALVSRGQDGEDGPPNLFLVGDVKQSIYRFRLADPKLFLSKYEDYCHVTGHHNEPIGNQQGYPPYLGAVREPPLLKTYSMFGGSTECEDDPPATTGPRRRIDLQANFRSRAAVVDGVNFLFRQIMTPDVGEMAYDQAAELVCQADYPPPDEENGGIASPADRSMEACAEMPLVHGHSSFAEDQGQRTTDKMDAPIELHLLERELPGSFQPESDPAPDGRETSEREDPEGDESEEPTSPDLPTLEDLSQLEREAVLIARRIRDLVGSGLPIWDKEGRCYRPIRYRDIVILLRATRGRAGVFLDILPKSGIPAHTEVSSGYFSAPEVDVMLSLLKILDNPRQDIPLASVLRSPLVGLQAADLARIRLHGPDDDFFTAVERMASWAKDPAAPDQGTAQEGAPGVAAILRQFLHTLDHWRTLARRGPLSQLIWQVYRETGYLAYVEGLPGGAQRRANLLALYDRARQFDQFDRQGLFRFLRFVERLLESEGDLGTPPALGENEDVVRILSVHKSKGLEYPVVFVADIGKSFNLTDLNREIVLQKDLGVGPLVILHQERARFPSLAHRAIAEVCRRETLSEEMRILYVALTRARERLILVGSAKGLEKKCAGWLAHTGGDPGVLPEALLAGGRSWLDWLGPALARHRAGEPLRQLGGVWESLLSGHPLASDSSRWEIRVWSSSETASLPIPGKTEGYPRSATGEVLPLQGKGPSWQDLAEIKPLDRPPNLALFDRLDTHFRWRYSYADLVRRYAKVSVTEIKARFAPEEARAADAGELPGPGDPPTAVTPAGRLSSRRPRFLQGGRPALSPMDRGMVTHLILQHLDLTQDVTPASIRSQVEDLVRREILTAEWAAGADLAAIRQFFGHPLGRRLLAAPKRVRREIPFLLGLPVHEVYPDLVSEVVGNERVVVQGVIDCLFEEEAGLVLIDFKTDALYGSTEASNAVLEAAAGYRGQMLLYARALKEILRQPVVEAYLYFLALGQAVAVFTGGDSGSCGHLTDRGTQIHHQIL